MEESNKENVIKMDELHQKILEFIESEENDETEFHILLNYINDNDFKKNMQEVKLILHIVSKISNNHYRGNNFFEKIEKIIQIFQTEIHNYFTQYDILQIFKSNKRVLLLLFEKSILIPDKTFLKIITEKRNYDEYFYPEFESFYDQSLKDKINFDYSNIEEFKEKRKVGENDSYICSLIRNDSVINFISYVEHKQISLESTINHSIFETNPLFLKMKNPSLIEYAAFFGSIQIFTYLFRLNVKLIPLLWIYAIHGNNPDIIHFLEQNDVSPDSYTYYCIYLEAIKCHHTNIANYINDNHQVQHSNNIEMISYCIHFYNFIFLHKNNFGFDMIFNFIHTYDFRPFIDSFLRNEYFKLSIYERDSLNETIYSIFF